MTKERVEKTISVLVFLSLVSMVFALSVRIGDLRRNLKSFHESAFTPKIGSYLPPVLAQSVDGSTVDLAALQFPGPTILFIFETDCPFCKESLPAMNELHERVIEDFGIDFAGVSFDAPSAVTHYSEINGIRFPLFSVADGHDRSYLGVEAVPTLLLVDTARVVRWARTGVVLGTDVADSLAMAVDQMKSSNP